MTIYNIANFMTGFVEAIMMFILYDTFCEKRLEMSRWINIFGILILTIMINISNHLFKYALLNVVCMATACFAISFIYKAKIPLRIVISVLSFLIMGVIEIFILFFITLIYNISVSDVIHSEEHKLLGIIISKFTSFLAINIMRIKFKSRRIKVSFSYWLLLIIMFLTTTFTVFVIFKLSYDNKNVTMYNLSIICSAGFLFTTFFSLYLYERLERQSETIRIDQQYKSYLKTQISHLDELVANRKKVQSFRHDLKNYMKGIEGYLENGNCEEALKYIRDIDSEVSLAKDVVDTGNTALDSIISSKKRIAEKKNISFATILHIPEKLPIDFMDVCVIFGNALDNAIEACDRVNSLDKKIIFSLKYCNDTLRCSITNSSPPIESNDFKTTKFDKENHGFGLNNIREALSKYNTKPLINSNDKEFTIKFEFKPCWDDN